MMPNVIQLDARPPGASPDDWDHFSLILGLTADLLPVVSNAKAPISPRSHLKTVGKVPSVYNAERHIVGLARWTEHISTDADITKWARERDYGICIQTRTVRALDIDIEDADAAAEVQALIAEHFELPARTRENSAKCLLAFRIPGEHTKRILRTAHGAIEFLASGQQFISIGRHPSGVRYEWQPALPEAFPTLTVEAFEALWDQLVTRFAIEPPVELGAASKAERLTDAVTADPIARHLAAAGMVLREDKRTGALHITCPFAAEHTTAGDASSTTYFPAHTGGYELGHFNCLHAHCAHRTDAEFTHRLGLVLDDFEDLSAAITVAATADIDAPINRFGVIPAATFALRPAPRWIIKGVLPQAELAVLFGESGSGKSFLALDLSIAIARGTPWRGHKARQGRVVYIAAEGAGGFRNRLLAYTRGSGIPLEDIPIGVIANAPNLLERTDAIDVAKAIVASGGADVVIVDTFAQATPGANENAGEDVGRALAHCKGIHRATGALVVLVHHAGKDLSKGARGWSGLRAAADAEIEVSRDEEYRCARISKQKDGEDGDEFGFRLAPVTIGVDEDGEDITSCIVEPVESRPKASIKNSPRGVWERLVLDVVREFGSVQTAGIEVEGVVIEAVRRAPRPEGKDNRRERVKRALLAMANRNLLAIEDDCINV